MPHETTLSREEARRFYDRFGKKQDAQGFYEDRALALLRAQGDFAHATSVVELGCGTGKLAASLLGTELAAPARYLGLDLSSTMVRLATERTRPFGERARVAEVDGTLPLPVETASADRFLSTYVFDLLGPDDMEAMLAEAHRILRPEGLLCIAGLTPGTSGLSRLTSSAWKAVHRLSPGLVGGCRPVRMGTQLKTEQWELRFDGTVTSVTIASEVLVAARR